MRILLYTGKGGVGKTSIAASTGLKLSQKGYKTIVISLDTAHSLADAFDLDDELIYESEEPVRRVNDRLFIQEIDIQRALKEYWSEVTSYLELVLKVSGLDQIVAEEVAVFPGMEEVCALLYINQYYRQKKYDVIVSNPPYVLESEKMLMKQNVLNYEPEIALFVDDINALKYYESVIKFSLNNLNPQGQIFFETNENYKDELNKLAQNYEYNIIEFKLDINDKNRFLILSKVG